MYNLILTKSYKKAIISRGTPVRASRTPRGPRNTVWETLINWMDGYFDCPYLCVWFPKESHRYSRRLPAFCVFGCLKSHRYCIAKCRTMLNGVTFPNIYRTAPT